MKQICVFCGSSLGFPSVYREAATELGKMLALKKIGLVYGGANVGIMKVLADTVLQSGGEVIGVMPQSLIDKEVAHQGLSKFHIVQSMAERKELMVQLSDAFIAFPGGFGTLDELSEILTFNQLRITDKPLGFLNISGYFDLLFDFIDHGVKEGFIRGEHQQNLIISTDCESILSKLVDFVPVSVTKWIEDIKVESEF
jgi:uncharacterized protein (TIGR00730 family)